MVNASHRIAGCLRALAVALTLIALTTDGASAQGQRPVPPPADPAGDVAADLPAALEQANAAFAEGRYEAALALFLRIEAAQERSLGPAARDTLWTAFSIANTLTALDRLDEALARFDRIAPLYHAAYGADDAETWRLEMSWSAALADARRYDEAIAKAVRAIDRFRAILGEWDTTTIYGYGNLASVYQERGFLDEAMAVYTRVLPGFDHQRNFRRAAHRAAMLVSAARLAVRIDRPVQALDWYREAIPLIWNVFGEDHPDFAEALIEAAELAYRLGALDETGTWLATGRPVVLRLHGRQSYLAARYDVMIARHFAAVNGTAAAEDRDMVLDLLFQALEVFDAVLPPDSPEKARALAPILTIALGEADWGVALELAEELRGLRRVGREDYARALRGAVGAGLISPDEAVARAFAAAQEQQKSRVANATDFMAAQLALASQGPAGAILKELADGMQKNERDQGALIALLNAGDPDPAAAAGLRAALSAWPAENRRLLDALEAAAPDYGAMIAPKPLTLAEVQARLTPAQALVLLDTARPGETASYVFVVTAETAHWLPARLGDDAGAALVTRVRASIGARLGTRAGVALAGRDRPAGTPDFDFAAAHALYTGLFGEAEALLDTKSDLLIELRGPLTALPPELLLRRPATGLDGADWLVRHHSVVVLPSVAALGAGRGGSPAPEPFLGLADPVFTPEAHPGAVAGLDVDPARRAGVLAPLPETADEVRAVAAALGAPQSMRAAAEASEAFVKSTDLSAFRLLYFATHGLVAGDLVAQGAVREPALALSAGGGEDGLLTASEIAALRLNADWVVLSACNTALGGTPGAEALSGLAQAFVHAGARALLVSHWPVESKSAVALMTDLFARRAADPGLSAAEAQRQAILAMIDDPARGDWAHPAYWAPFVLVGDPG